MVFPEQSVRNRGVTVVFSPTHSEWRADPLGAYPPSQDTYPQVTYYWDSWVAPPDSMALGEGVLRVCGGCRQGKVSCHLGGSMG